MTIQYNTLQDLRKRDWLKYLRFIIIC